MDDQDEARRRVAVDVVALVTSAGGLDALSAVLGQLPPDLPAAVVVQQHLSGQGSQLVAILRRRTGHRIEWAEDGLHLEPGLVLVTPPRRSVEVLPDGSCALSESEVGALGRPHDRLLTSLADSYGARALAVVLTGMGDDGAAGVRALKAVGGIVVAQSQDTAEQPAMPRAAVEAGAELVLALHRIGAVVADVVGGAPLPRDDEERDAVSATFGDRGRVAAAAREVDWSRHPLGPVRRWPPTLRGALRVAADYPTPCTVMWGEELFHFYNDEAVPTHGDRHPGILGVPARQVFPDLTELVEDMWQKVRAGRTLHLPAMVVPMVRGASVHDVWFDFVHVPLRDTDGAVAGVFSVWNDRTAEVVGSRRMGTLNRLSAVPASHGRQGALRAASAVLEHATDVPFAAAYLLDTDGHAQLVQSVGLPADSAMAPPLVRVAPGGPWPLHLVLDSGRQVLVDDLAARFRGHLVGPERTAPETAVLHPLRDEATDRVVGVLVLGASPRLPFDDRYREFLTLVGDTVAGKAAESHARERERQRLAQLSDLDRAKTEFLSNVSHEFRTPLTLLLAPLEEALGRADELPTGIADELLVAQRSARRLLRLVGTLLDFSQIEAGRLRARFAPTDLTALTAEIASMFRSAAEAAGLKLTLDTTPLSARVWVDPEMWEKIVSNLISNALKFTWTGGIEVGLRALPKHAELVVRDTGVGIPAAELPHVLQRFHRVPGARGRTHEGTGIGLALVDELVRRHHGRVRVTSELGSGTTVTVWIPLGRRPAAEGTPAPVPWAGEVAAAMAEEATSWDATREHDLAALGLDELAAVTAPPVRMAGARVLVVDDNPDMRDYLGRLLGSTWPVTAARDGAEALELARRDRPDLMLADVMMPVLDGFALLRAIRADEALAALPVVLLTARAGEQTAIEGLLAGADDYVVKPFSARELVARVAAQLELAGLRRRLQATDAFRLALTDTLRTMSDPGDMQARAAALLGRHLGASRAYYQEFDDAAGTVTIHGDHTDGLTSLEGSYRIADHGRGLADEELRAGRSLVVRDSADLAAPARAAWTALSVRAGIVAPVLRAGVCVAALGVSVVTPRDWTEEEVALVEETAERTWAAVERARAEAALRASEERLRLALEATRLGVFDWDLTTDQVTVNARFREMFGLPGAGDVIGADMMGNVVHPDDRDFVNSHIAAAMNPRSDGRYEFEHRALTPAGELWLLTLGQVHFSGEGADRRAVRVVGNDLDISDHRRPGTALGELTRGIRGTVRTPVEAAATRCGSPSRDR